MAGDFWVSIPKGAEVEDDAMQSRWKRQRTGENAMGTLSDIEALSQRDRIPRFFNRPSEGAADPVEQWDYMWHGDMPDYIRNMNQLPQPKYQTPWQTGPQPIQPPYQPLPVQEDEVYIPQPRTDPQLATAVTQMREQVQKAQDPAILNRIAQARENAQNLRPQATASPQHNEEYVKALGTVLSIFANNAELTIDPQPDRYYVYWKGQTGYLGVNRFYSNDPAYLGLAIMDRYDPTVEDDIIKVYYGQNIEEFKSNLSEALAGLYGTFLAENQA